MKARELSQKYATAIFGLALEKWVTSLNAVQDRLDADDQLLKKLDNTEHAFSERQQELDNLIPAEADQGVRNFLYTLLEEGDIGLLKQTLTVLEQMSRGGPMVQVTYVTTAVALDDDEKERFRQKLRAQYGDNLEFQFNVDPSILGGAVVQIGDKVIDGSVATRLESMSNVLGVKG